MFFVAGGLWRGLVAIGMEQRLNGDVNFTDFTFFMFFIFLRAPFRLETQSFFLCVYTRFIIDEWSVCGHYCRYCVVCVSGVIACNVVSGVELVRGRVFGAVCDKHRTGVFCV